MPIYTDVCTQCGRTISSAEENALRCNRCGCTSFIRYDLGNEANRKRREELEKTWRAQQSPPSKGLLLCAFLGTGIAALSFFTTGLVRGGAILLMGLLVGHATGGKRRTIGKLVIEIATIVLTYVAVVTIISAVLGLQQPPW